MRGNDTREDISVKDRQELFEVKDSARPGVGEGKGSKSRVGICREICLNLREELYPLPRPWLIVPSC